MKKVIRKESPQQITKLVAANSTNLSNLTQYVITRREEVHASFEDFQVQLPGMEGEHALGPRIVWYTKLLEDS